jgi:pilus assembly protein CpaE
MEDKPMDDQLKILLASDDETIHNQLLNSVGTTHEMELIETSELVREINRVTRDIVIIVQPEKDNAVELIQHVLSVNSATVTIFISKTQDFNLLRSITRVGASEFFVYPDEHSLFVGRFPSILKTYEQRKRQMNETAAGSFIKGSGQIFSFYSGKGGSGKTLLSTTFAQTLKLESTAQVILLDMNFQYGGVETLLSIESNRSIADLTPVMAELNESHIRNVSYTENHSKLEILLSPCDAEVGETLSEDFIAKLLRTCRRSFDFVVVDLPSYINGQVFTALEESDFIYYILTPDTPSLTIMKKVEELNYRLGIDVAGRMQIVLNQAAKENEIQPNDLKNMIRHPIVTTIRRDIKGVQGFVNKGEAIRKQGNEKRLIPFAKDVHKWVLSVLK